MLIKTPQLFALLLLSVVACGDADVREVRCPESTRPHKTECNKYFKCIKLPSNSLSWVALTCQTGLIYDKNLRSCAIPPENWDCNLSGEEESDESDTEGNIYGVENLDEDDDDDDYTRREGDEFLEVIDGVKDLEGVDGKSRSEDAADYSGDGDLPENFVTPSSPTVRMVTAQVQRVTQLLQSIPKNNNDISADDLNAYLATQKIQSNSPDYQKIDFNSNDKTTVPADGRIHPEIQTEIINRQNDMNYRLTTQPMDATTVKPIFYLNKEPVTEIKLKSGLDGIGAHQIVVNRPEGSVMFNVPAKSENNKLDKPYLSEDLLKTILELSKQMVMQKTGSNQESGSSQHPVYYALPIPIIPPQNHVQNYYYPNQTEPTTTTTTQLPKLQTRTRKPPSKPKFQPQNNRINYKQQQQPDSYSQINNQYPSSLKQNQQGNYQQFDYPINYYSPYTSNYPQAYSQFYNSMPYYQYSNSDRYPQNNVKHFNNFNGAYYGNRPFVSDSSAPFVDHTAHESPYRKESFTSSSSSSYENDDYDALREESDENVDDFSSHSTEEYDEEENPPKGPTDGLICTSALSRQANKTDCYKYYVCNAKTKEVLTYTCPAFTAFNDQTKYCDSAMYKSCKKSQDGLAGSLKNSKIYAEAQKALQQAKRESQKVERIANIVRKQSQQIINHRTSQVAQEYEDEQVYQPPPVPQRRKQVVKKSRPKPTKRVSVYKQASIKRRRTKGKVKCIAPGNIADPLDKSSYWHCFKSTDGRMKRIHKKCTSNLRFCAASTYCSLSC